VYSSGLQFSPVEPGSRPSPTPGPPPLHFSLGDPRSGLPASTGPGLDVSKMRAFIPNPFLDAKTKP
jgi:hypothetical protein